MLSRENMFMCMQEHCQQTIVQHPRILVTHL